MQICCPKCQAEYELDPPAAPFARDQDLVFRCSACGTSIPLRSATEGGELGEADEPDTDVLEAPKATPSPQFVLKQEGNSYHVKDEAMLQRWIAERRVWPDDEISVEGAPWTRVGSIEKYSVFFKLSGCSLPKASCSSRCNSYSALLLLLHPIHGCSPIMNFTNLM